MKSTRSRKYHTGLSENNYTVITSAPSHNLCRRRIADRGILTNCGRLTQGVAGRLLRVTNLCLTKYTLDMLVRMQENANSDTIEERNRMAHGLRGTERTIEVHGHLTSTERS